MTLGMSLAMAKAIKPSWAAIGGIVAGSAKWQLSRSTARPMPLPRALSMAWRMAKVEVTMPMSYRHRPAAQAGPSATTWGWPLIFSPPPRSRRT